MENKENMAQKQSPKKKTNKSLLFAITIIGIVVIFFAGRYIVNSFSYTNSDNAQIDGNIIPVRTKTGGYILDLRFIENQFVKKGDTLAIMDTTELKALAEKAEAKLESAKLMVKTRYTGKESATFNTKAATENISSARAKLRQAKNDFDRINAMYKKGATTPQEYDAAKSALDMARARYKAIKAQKETAGAQITEQDLQIQIAESKVKEAKAELSSARYLLKNCYITAPCNGIISKKTVEEGQLCLKGTSLAMLIDLDNLWITANLKETKLSKIDIGQQVKVSVDAYPDMKIAGEVESLAGATGPKFSLLPPDNATGNFIKITQRIPVRIAIKHIKSKISRQLVPGMNVVVDIKKIK